MAKHRRRTPARTVGRTLWRAVAVGAAIAVICLPAAGPAGATSLIPSLGPVTSSSPVTPASFGLIGATSDQLSQLSGSKVTMVTLSSGWQQVEPQQNVYDASILAQLRGSLDSLRSQGFQVVLDLGLQYPPAWAFSLPGATRFVDQYGDVWHGSLSQDVPNGVFNPAVRAAEADYITHLAAALGPENLASVRVGGLLSGELRYPPNTYLGHQDLLWDYDSFAQAGAPVPGWVPGTGTADEIRSSLGYYFDSLTSYQTWLMNTVNAAFPGVNQQVMFPSFGLRPGMVDDVVAAGMQNNTVAEVNGLISAGLDWADQVKAISDAGINGTVYTTWLDGPTEANTIQGEAPVDYLASLATQYDLPIAGENSGGGGTSALNLCVQRVQADHLTGMMYMSGQLVANGSAGVTVSDLEAAASTLSP